MDLEKYQPVIKDILRKLRVNKDQKEDMAQECCMALLENELLLDAARDPINYAATLCRHHVIDLWRKEGRRVQTDSLDDPRTRYKASKIASSEPLGDRVEMMDEAMKLLDEDELEVVNRIYRKGYSRMEAAVSLGVHPSTVDRRARSGVEKLREYFEVSDGI